MAFKGNFWHNDHSLRETKLMKKILDYLKKKWLTILLVLIAILGVGYWQLVYSAETVEVPVTQHPQVRTLEKTLDAPGVIDAKMKAQMRFAAGGLLTRLNFQEGDVVKKWQTIAVIDRRTLEKQLQKDLNMYSKERLDWDQTLDDVKDRAIPKEEEREKDKSQYDLTNTVLDVEIRDIAIKNTVLSAPFGGIITKSPTTTSGVQLSAGDYFELVDPESLLFRAQIDELDIARVAVGQTAEITLDAFSEEPFDATLTSVSFTSSQSSSGTVFLVEFSVPSDVRSKLRIGMNGEAKIMLEKKDMALSVPAEAVRDRGDSSFVDVWENDQKVEKEVVLGLQTDDFIEITSGLNELDNVVIPE